MPTLPHDSSRDLEHAPAIMQPRAEAAFGKIIRDFESVADEAGMPRPSAEELRELCGRVIELSWQVFPGGVGMKVSRDLDIPDDVYFVVEVCTSDSPDEFIARVREWDRAMHRAIGSRARLFCLSF